MLNGYVKGKLAGSGMVVWKGREMHAAGEINEEQFIDYVASGCVMISSSTHSVKSVVTDSLTALRLSGTATQWERHRP